MISPLFISMLANVCPLMPWRLHLATLLRGRAGCGCLAFVFVQRSSWVFISRPCARLAVT